MNRQSIGKVGVAHFLAFVTVAIWGSTFVFTKMLLLNGLSPAHIFTLRFIIAYVLLLAFEMTVRRQTFRWLSASWRDELIMLLLGITGGSLYFLTENAAMLFTTATNTSLIVCSSAVCYAARSPCLSAERAFLASSGCGLTAGLYGYGCGCA